MKKIAYTLFILATIFITNGCEESIVPELEYITFSSASYSAGVDPGGSTTLDITVYSTNLSSSDRSYAVSIDPSSNAAAGSYTVPSSVTIPAGSNEGTLSVSLTDTNLGIGVNKLVLLFDSSSDYFIGGKTTLSYVQNCSEITASLSLNFDRWGSEVYWEIRDALGSVVAKTNGYPDTGSGTTTSDTVSINLCSGRNYTFFASDAYGDGWGTGSSYTLTIGGTVKVSGDASGLDPTGVSAAFNTN